MDHYGQMAFEFSRDHRPTSHRQIPNPTAHFTEVGREIAAEVTATRDEILGAPRPGEDPGALRIRSSQALATAREIVLNSHPCFVPETPTTDEAEDDPDRESYQGRLSMINEALA